MAKAKKKDVSGVEHFEQFVVELTEKSPDGKFSSYENFQGEDLDGHRTVQKRGKPEKT